MKGTNLLIVGVVAAGALYYLFRMGGIDKLKGLVHANATFPFTDDLFDGNVQGFTTDLEDYIHNAISQAGGDPNGSFQNISVHRNINTGSGGNINQSFDQEQDS
jgi:hypothetical protein